ncbi:hypothetical protein EXW46_02015 [Bacillus mycoides]|nr:hypothetical protein EXW46_02015 [Bacillus mycoides]
MWLDPTSINLTYIFIQNVVFPRSFLLSFIDVIKVGTSNKPWRISNFSLCYLMGRSGILIHNT